MQVPIDEVTLGLNPTQSRIQIKHLTISSAGLALAVLCGVSAGLCCLVKVLCLVHSSIHVATLQHLKTYILQTRLVDMNSPFIDLTGQ